MTVAEGQRFLAHENAPEALELRRADDLAKDPVRPTSLLSSWRPILVQVAARAEVASAATMPSRVAVEPNATRMESAARG
jgi:hypothetical protein